MSMLRTSSDGAFVFTALEDVATGFQLIFKTTRPTTSTPTTVIVYEPLAGSAGNVAQTNDDDRMVWHGNFDTDIGVVDYAIIAETNTDISPVAIGAEVIQPLEVNPDFVGNILAWNEDDDDLLQTEDVGANWATVRSDAGLVTTLRGMDVLFKGNFQDHNVYFTGDGGSGVKVYESLDEGITLIALENATLNTAADVVGIVVVGA